MTLVSTYTFGFVSGTAPFYLGLPPELELARATVGMQRADVRTMRNVFSVGRASCGWTPAVLVSDGAICPANIDVDCASRVGGGKVSFRDQGPPNGPEVNPRGQGPRGYGSAARRLPHLNRAMQAA